MSYKMAKIDLNEEEIAKILSSLIGRIKMLEEHFSTMKLWGSKDLPTWQQFKVNYESLKDRFENLLRQERKKRTTEHIT